MNKKMVKQFFEGRFRLKIILKYVFCFGFFLNYACTNEPENTFKKQPKVYQENNSSKTPIENKVVGIKDGDTYSIIIDGKQETVRLKHIDCPEKNQAYGQKAKTFSSDLVFGKQVRLVWDGKRDQYKRIVAEVWVGDTNINKELVKNGYAWHYKQYSKDKSYTILETEARAAKIGLWADNNPTAPWLWRKEKKRNAKQN